MAKLTEKSLATAVTLNSLIHIVNTGDTTQSAYGSSYKAELSQLVPLFGSNPDVTVTGGTYNPSTGEVTFYNNTGGTFNVSGFVTGFTDSFVSGGTYTAGTATFTNTTGGTFTVTGFTNPFTGGSSNCITDLYVTNIHSCSPLNINPSDEGNVYFGSTSGVTIDIINGRIGIGNKTPLSNLHVSGTTYFDTTGLTTTTTPAFRFLDGVSTPTDTVNIKSFYKEFRPTTTTANTVVGDGTLLYPNITSASSAEYYASANLTFFTNNLSNLSSVEALTGEINVISIYSNTGTYNGIVKSSSAVLENAIAGGTIDKYVGFWANGLSSDITHNGTTNNIYGFYMDSQSGRSGNVPATTNRYGVYIEDGGRNYFAGTVGIGTDTPSEKLEVSGKTKTTNIQITSGATNGYVLTSDASGNGTWQSGATVNIYNSDGSLTGNRTVSQGSFDLNLNGDENSKFQTTYTSTINPLDVSQFYTNVNTTSIFHLDDTNDLQVSTLLTPGNSSLGVSVPSTNEYAGLNFNSTSADLVHFDGTSTTRELRVNSNGIWINQQYYLPNVDGTSSQVLTTNGAGITSWQNLYGYQHYTAVTITSAQTLTIGTLPVQILPAPGANKYYDIKTYFEYVFNSTAYSSTGTFQLVDNTTKRVTNQFDINGQLVSRVFVSDMNFQNQFTSLNSQIDFTTSNSTDPTLGDGYFKIKVYYNIVDFG